MKLYKGSKKTGILLIAILTLSTLSTEVLGDGAMVTGGTEFGRKIKRTCEASYSGLVTGISYSLNRSTGKMEKYLPIPSTEKVELRSSIFKARRGCGKSVPNRCRKRSRNTLLNCAKAVAQFPNSVPNECRVDSIENYPTNMIFDMGRRACKPLSTERGMLVTTFPKPYFVHLMLYVDIWGRKGCGKKDLGKTTVIDGRNYPISGIGSGKYQYVRFPLKQVTIDCH